MELWRAGHFHITHVFKIHSSSFSWKTSLTLIDAYCWNCRIAIIMISGSTIFCFSLSPSLLWRKPKDVQPDSERNLKKLDFFFNFSSSPSQFAPVLFPLGKVLSGPHQWNISRQKATRSYKTPYLNIILDKFLQVYQISLFLTLLKESFK